MMGVHRRNMLLGSILYLLYQEPMKNFKIILKSHCKWQIDGHCIEYAVNKGKLVANVLLL